MSESMAPTENKLYVFACLDSLRVTPSELRSRAKGLTEHS